MNARLEEIAKIWPGIQNIFSVPHNEAEYSHLIDMLDGLIDEVGEDESHPLASLMETLGTQFIAHPPIMPFRVRTADAEHPLVQGIGEFETDDELYLSRVHGDLQMLLYAEFSGAAPGFVESDWNDDAPRPGSSYWLWQRCRVKAY